MARKKAATMYGFSCPLCGIEMRVAYTRKVASSIVLRCRECPKCGHMQPTEERPRSIISKQSPADSTPAR